jgi:ATP-binding cassette subfamily F protein 3
MGWKPELRKYLPEMGFRARPMATAMVGEFSGGWQMRMGLGKILLQAPDVLLLDEPTNHLDLETIEWLETYLKGLTTPMVIVSHDREFLDRLCTQIVETERGVSTTYLGNYSAYLTQKAGESGGPTQRLRAAAERIGQSNRLLSTEFRASATRSTQAKSREKQLEKIERIEAPEASGRNPCTFASLTHPRSGQRSR